MGCFFTKVAVGLCRRCLAITRRQSDDFNQKDRFDRLCNHATAQVFFSSSFTRNSWPGNAPWAMLLVPVHQRVLKGEDGSTRKPESEKGIMKKFLTMGALALALTAVYSAPAPAWLNWKFGIGMNLGWQSGGNNTLWGLFRNGQPPGPDCGMGGGCRPAPDRRLRRRLPAEQLQRPDQHGRRCRSAGPFRSRISLTSSRPPGATTTPTPTRWATATPTIPTTTMATGITTTANHRVVIPLTRPSPHKGEREGQGIRPDSNQPVMTKSTEILKSRYALKLGAPSQ